MEIDQAYERAKAEFAALYAKYQRLIFEIKPQYLMERRRVFYDTDPTNEEIAAFEDLIKKGLADFNAVCKKMVENEYVTCHFPDPQFDETLFALTQAQALSDLQRGKTLFPYRTRV